MYVYLLPIFLSCMPLPDVPDGPRDALLFHETYPPTAEVFLKGFGLHLARHHPPFPLEVTLSRNDEEILAALRGETGHRVRFVVAELPPPNLGHSLQRILHRSLEAGLLLPEHLVLMALDLALAERFNQYHQGAMSVLQHPCGINAVWAALRPRLEAFYASK